MPDNLLACPKNQWVVDSYPIKCLFCEIEVSWDEWNGSEI